MSWGAVIGAGIGAVASIVGSQGASHAAGSAGRLARDAEWQMYNQNREDLAPYRQAGYGALNEVQNLFMGSAAERAGAMSRFETSPDYQFRRDEGLRGIQNSAAAREGGLGSSALRRMTAFNSNLASGEFNNYVDRLFGIAGLGQGATNTGVAAGQNTANNISNIYQNQGNARASAYLTGAAGVNNAVQGGLQNWAFNTYMNQGRGDGP